MTETDRSVRMAAAMSGKPLEGYDSLEDQIRRFEEKIGLRNNPDDLALEQHKAMLKAQGKEWDDTVVTAVTANDWMYKDVEYTGMSALG